MKYALWYVTEENFEIVAEFATLSLAKNMLALCSSSVKYGHYELTLVGNTPVW